MLRLPALAPPYQNLARFAGNLATCIEAGVGLEQALRTTGRTLSTTRFAAAIDTAIDRIREGAELSAALSAEDVRWPPFLIPFVKAGEQSGRLGESLRYLEQHCKLLDRPARALYRTWSIPLAIMLTGSVIEIAAHLWLAPFPQAVWRLFAAVQSYGSMAVLAYFLFGRPFKGIVDPMKLVVPIIGSLERELAVNRFFCVLSMLYATSGQRVESMIRLAAQAVPNVILRQDLLRAGGEIERGASIPSAFDASTRLQDEERQLIAAGDLAGTLDGSFTRISHAAGERLQHRLEMIHQFAFRLMLLLVSMSLAFALLRLLRQATAQYYG